MMLEMTKSKDRNVMVCHHYETSVDADQSFYLEDSDPPNRDSCIRLSNSNPESGPRDQKTRYVIHKCGHPSKGPGHNTKKLLKYNRKYYAEKYNRCNPANFILCPQRKVALVTCMDARILPSDIFGLEIGDIHVIRNAGGVVTDDVLRSLSISQTLLGTNEIIVMHHVRCGMREFTSNEVNKFYQKKVGVRARWFWEEFEDGVCGVVDNVKENVRRILDSPFIFEKCHITGALYNEKNGKVHVLCVRGIYAEIPFCKRNECECTDTDKI